MFAWYWVLNLPTTWIVNITIPLTCDCYWREFVVQNMCISNENSYKQSVTIRCSFTPMCPMCACIHYRCWIMHSVCSRIHKVLEFRVGINVKLHYLIDTDTYNCDFLGIVQSVYESVPIHASIRNRCRTRLNYNRALADTSRSGYSDSHNQLHNMSQVDTLSYDWSEWCV